MGTFSDGFGSDLEDMIGAYMKPSDNKKPKDLAGKRNKLFQTGSQYLTVKRSDIAGIDNLLFEADKIIHALRHSEEYLKHGARLQPGALFSGMPGTGKTMLARFIATESGALFVDCRDFGHDGGSWTDQDIRELFRLARENYAKNKRPIILFFDEFEAVAKTRSQASTVHMATISELTSQLDGVMGKMPGVFMIGCTNYETMIDEALTRDGRLGVHLKFSPPDRNGKALLLHHYTGRLTTFSPTIDFNNLAFFFNENATAASIEETVHDGWRVAVARSIKEAGSPQLTNEDLMAVLLDRLLGPRPSFSNLTKDRLYKVAIHECGHAIVALEVGVPLRLVTVRPSTEALGKTIYDIADPLCGTQQELYKSMQVAAGSFIAEELVYGKGERILGAHGDTRSITQNAIYLIDNNAYGSAFNPAAMRDRFYNQDPSISTNTVDNLDLQITQMIHNIEREVKDLLQNKVGKDKIEAMAKLVFERETIIGRDFQQEYGQL